MDFKELIVYPKAFKLAIDIFEGYKTFPKEKQYSLTDQVRRSSRSTCTKIAEAYRERRYPQHVLNNLTDSDGENSETASWLDSFLPADISMTKFAENALTNVLNQVSC